MSFTWGRGFIPTLHLGDDLVAPTGTPIHAVAGGRVAWAGDSRTDRSAPWWTFWLGLRGAAGIAAAIDVGGGRSELYVHMSRVDVATGQAIAASSVVGAVGQTGNATGPHVHFGVLDGRTFRDPLVALGLSSAQLLAAVGGSGPAGSSSGVWGTAGLVSATGAPSYRISDAQWNDLVLCATSKSGFPASAKIGAAALAAFTSCAAAAGVSLVGITTSSWIGLTWSQARDQLLASGTLQKPQPIDIAGAVLGGLAGALSPLLWLGAILVLILLGLYLTVSPSGGGSQ